MEEGSEEEKRCNIPVHVPTSLQKIDHLYIAWERAKLVSKDDINDITAVPSSMQKKCVYAVADLDKVQRSSNHGGACPTIPAENELVLSRRE